MLPEKRSVNLKAVANRAGLAPCSVSAVLNNTPAARAIPQATKDRVFRAAAELNYRPNLWARSLRTKRTRMVAVLTPDIGRPAVARVVASAQRMLHEHGYLLVLGTSESSNTYSLIQQRGIEGLITIEAGAPKYVDLPVATVELSNSGSINFSDRGHSWLTEMGKAAAETIIRLIEKEDSPRKVRIEVMISSPHIGFHDPNGVARMTQESA